MNAINLQTKRQCMTSMQMDEFLRLVHSSNGADVLFAQMRFANFESKFVDDYYLSKCRLELKYALYRLEQYVNKYKQMPE